MSRIFLAFFALLGALSFAGCGGHTGLEIEVSVPREMKPGLDFNKIRVQVDAQEGGTAGETYPLSTNSQPPYVVYVFSDKTVHYKTSLRVELWQDAAIKKTKLVPDIILEQGEIKLVNVDMTQ